MRIWSEMELIEKCGNAAKMVQAYKEKRREEKYNETEFNNLCKEILSLFECWTYMKESGITRIQSERYAIDSLFAELYNFMYCCDNFVGGYSDAERQLSQSVKYKKEVYKKDDDGENKYNGYFDAWSKNRDQNMQLAATPDDKMFGIDVDAFIAFCKRNEIDNESNREINGIVVFPNLKHYVSDYK